MADQFGMVHGYDVPAIVGGMSIPTAMAYGGGALGTAIAPGIGTVIGAGAMGALGSYIVDQWGQRRAVDRGDIPEVDQAQSIISAGIGAIPGASLYRGGSSAIKYGLIGAENVAKTAASRSAIRGYHGDDPRLTGEDIMTGVEGIPLAILGSRIAEIPGSMMTQRGINRQIVQANEEQGMLRYNAAVQENQRASDLFRMGTEQARESASAMGMVPGANEASDYTPIIDWEPGIQERVAQNQRTIMSQEDPLAATAQQRKDMGAKGPGWLAQQLGNVRDVITQRPMTLKETGQEDWGAAGRMFDEMSVATTKRDQLIADRRAMLEPLQAEVKKLSPEAKRASAEAIQRALNDRKNADQYMEGQPPLTRKRYEVARSLLDKDQAQIEAHGIEIDPEIRDNYAQHVFSGDSPLYAADVSGDNMTTTSNRLKKRGATSELLIPTDWEKHYISKYLPSYTRELFYRPIAESYVGQYADHPEMTDFMTNILNPKNVTQTGATGKIGKAINYVTGKAYKNLVAYNPFSSAKNSTQRAWALANLTPEEMQIYKHISRHGEALGTKDFVEQPFQSRYDFTDEGLTTDDKSSKRATPFEMVEGGNWEAARAAGMAREVRKSKPYQEAVKAGAPPAEALVVALNDPEVRRRGEVHGRELSERTNLDNRAGYRPRMYEALAQKAPVTKPMFMMTRFATGEPEYQYNTFSRSGSEKRILGRGFEDEVGIVGSKREAEQMIRGTKEAVKTGMISKDLGKQEIQSLKTKVKDANMRIDEIEPRSKMGALKAAGITAGVGVATDLVRGAIKSEVVPAVSNQSQKKVDEAFQADIMRSIARNVPGMGGAYQLGEWTGAIDQSYPMAPLDKGIGAMIDYSPGPLGIIDNTIPGRPIRRSISSAFK